MLSKDSVLVWNEVDHDLYEENGHIFGVELDLYNNHQIYYCKTIENGIEYYEYLDFDDIYNSIELFNYIIQRDKTL